MNQNNADMKGNKGKKKKKKRSGSLGSGGPDTLLPIPALKSPTAPLQPVLGIYLAYNILMLKTYSYNLKILLSFIKVEVRASNFQLVVVITTIRIEFN